MLFGFSGFGDDTTQPTIPGLPNIPLPPIPAGTPKPDLPGYVTTEACAAQVQSASSPTGPNMMKYAMAAAVGAGLVWFLKK